MLNLLYLRYFFDTVRYQSVSRAAEANFVSQSAVSQGLKRLEAQLGLRLLTHCRKNVKITPEGERVFGRCQDVFSAVESLQEEGQEAAETLSGNLTFSTSRSLAAILLPPVLQRLQTMAPGIQPSWRPGHTGMVKEALAKRDIECGVVLDNEDLSCLECHLLFEGSFQVFESVQHPPFSTDSPVISSEPRPEWHQLQRGYHQVHGKEIQRCLEICSWELIADLTAQGLGPGVFPDFLAKSDRYRALIRPCEWGLPLIPYRLFFVYPAREALSKGAKLFLDLLNAEFGRLH